MKTSFECKSSIWSLPLLWIHGSQSTQAEADYEILTRTIQEEKSQHAQRLQELRKEEERVERERGKADRERAQLEAEREELAQQARQIRQQSEQIDQVTEVSRVVNLSMGMSSVMRQCFTQM